MPGPVTVKLLSNMVSRKPHKLGGMEGGETYTGEPREETADLLCKKTDRKHGDQKIKG